MEAGRICVCVYRCISYEDPRSFFTNFVFCATGVEAYGGSCF